jgi:multiple sugar transport system ATP-binding protein
VAPGQKVELAFDTTKLVLFDADTGANLSIPPAGAPEEEAAPPPPPPPAPQEEQTSPPSE